MKTLLLLAALILPLSAEEPQPTTYPTENTVQSMSRRTSDNVVAFDPKVEELKAQIEKLQAEVKSCSAVREAWKGLALQDAVQKFVTTVEQKAIDEAAKK